MKKLLFVFILSFCLASVFGQFHLDITTKPVPLNPATDKDTISLAIGQTLDWEIYPISGVDTLKNVTFFWDYGDDVKYKTTANTASHSFKEAGGYFVVVIARDEDNNTVKKNIPVRVSFDPFFTGTESDAHEKPICLGDKINLLGVAAPRKWKYEANTKKIENYPIDFDPEFPYFSKHLLREFSENEVFTDHTNLEKVCMRFEHSNIEDLEILLHCPNKSIVLKQRGGAANTFAGKPILENSADNGEPFTYCWAMDAENDFTMSEITEEQYTYTYTDENGTRYTKQSYIPEGSYKPYQSFQNLEGCELLGNWKIEVNTSNQDHNGFVFAWELKFKEDFITPKWTFENTYILADTSWRGAAVAKTEILPSEDNKVSGTSSGVPSIKGQNAYEFTVHDNWGYKHDTTVYVEVTPASFDASPEQIEIGDSIKFSSTTEWGVKYIWDFGNGNKTTEEKNVSNRYNDTGGYVDNKREYEVVLIAESAQACRDTVSKIITVKIPEWEKPTVPNVVTQTAQNDYFAPVFSKATIEASVKIYNRWGHKMWEWEKNNPDFFKNANNQENPGTLWRGWQVNDDNITPGIYFYVIESVDIKKDSHVDKGYFYYLKNE